MAEYNGERSAGEVVTGELLGNKHSSRKTNLRLIIALLITACLVIFSVIIFRIIQKQDQVKALENSLPKIKSMILHDNCSTSAQKSLSNLQPNQQQLNASIYLLTYRAYCLEIANHYRQANAVLEQQANYDSEANNQVDLYNVDQQIRSNDINIAADGSAKDIK